jgi:predicted house-cleaning noncanonical NTP pyrophosphatase (MazG superfamily)
MAKLVRDRIPELMLAAGEACSVEVLHADDDYIRALRDKLLEEVKEWLASSHSNEELIDIIEVVGALYGFEDHRTKGEVTRSLEKKHREKGGFTSRQYLL